MVIFMCDQLTEWQHVSAAHTKMEITNKTRTSEWKCMVDIVWNGGKNLMDYKLMEKKWYIQSDKYTETMKQETYVDFMEETY